MQRAAKRGTRPGLDRSWLFSAHTGRKVLRKKNSLALLLYTTTSSVDPPSFGPLTQGQELSSLDACCRSVNQHPPSEVSGYKFFFALCSGSEARIGSKSLHLYKLGFLKAPCMAPGSGSRAIPVGDRTHWASANRLDLSLSRVDATAFKGVCSLARGVRVCPPLPLRVENSGRIITNVL